MGDRALAQFEVDIKIGLGGRDDLDSYIARWANTAYLTLTTKKRIPGIKRTIFFPELEVKDESQSWVDASYRLSVPDGALIIRGVWDSTNDTKLSRFPTIREYWKRTDRESGDSKGEPTRWIRHESYLYTYPQSDDSYNATIYYRKRPTDLETDVQDVTEIGAEWDEAIYLLAMVQIHEKLGEFDRSEYKAKKFIEYVRDIIGIYDEEGNDAKRIFRPDEFDIQSYEYR